MFICERDTVLVRQPKWNKLTPTYKPKPDRTTHKKGSMITASHPDHVITRNSSHFKTIPSQSADPADADANAGVLGI